MNLLRECHEGRLEGGLSLSLRATPDEVVGPLTYAMGGAARKLRVLDVRVGRPMVMEISSGDSLESWELEDVPALISNLNSLFVDQPDVKELRVLGEWEDALQVQAVTKPRGAPSSRR